MISAGIATQQDTSGGGVSIDRLTPTSPARHILHDNVRDWRDSNCYADLWIEMLHALGCDPMAALSCTLAIDFEGDQWTFFKPPATDLQVLYGIDVQELTVWRPVIDHIETHLSSGQPLIVEVDAWYLPDSSVSYRTQHDKTAIAVHGLDRRSRKLEYFHGPGRYTLRGQDFDEIFSTHGRGVGSLVPHVELVKLDRLVHRDRRSLTDASVALARAQLARRPATNPVARYGIGVSGDAAWLAGQGIETFHSYAFATLRQLGAGSATAASYVRWLEFNDGVARDGSALSAADDLDGISAAAKQLQFAIARAVARKKAADFSRLLDSMADHWESAMTSLDRALAV